jgi:hypothetical protein
MAMNLGHVGKAFSVSVMQRAIAAFDRATMVVVLACWSGAILVMLFALYTLNLSVTAKRETIEAAAHEPSLPKMVNKPPTMAELNPLVDRLKQRYPELTFSLAGDTSLTISSNEGARFRTWLTVLSYIDTISPQYRWSMREFCVGVKCGSSSLMRAIVTAEKISFAPPAPRK